MKNNWTVKKLIEIVVGVVFTLFGVAFFAKGQYWQSLISVSLLIILLKDNLKKFILGPNTGLEAEFEISEDKIKKDIEENKEPINKKNLADFKEVEDRILKDVLDKIGGTMKRKIHFMYGMPDKPEFMFTPDATIQTDDKLIFIEIKYALKIELVRGILDGAVNQLKKI